MRPQSVSAPRVEEEFVQHVLPYLTLDDGWRDAVLGALVTEGPEPDPTLELKRIDGAMANLKKQHLWGSLSDEEFKAEFQMFQRQRRALEPKPVARNAPNLDRAAQLLRDLPALWVHPGVIPEQRRELSREVFQELRLREGRLVSVMPRPQYAPSVCLQSLEGLRCCR